MLKKKGFWIILAAVILAGAGVYTYLNKENSVKAQSTETSVQTAKAFLGTLTIAASGTGTVIPSEEANLGFYEAGTVGEILVSVGDEVEEGDVLATQGNSEDLELAVTNAELQLQLAQSALEEVYGNYQTELAAAQLTVVEAQLTLDDTEDSNALLQHGRCADDIVDEYYAAWVVAQREYKRIRDNQVPDSVIQAAEDALYAAWQNYNFCMTPYTDTEVAEGAANVSVAEAALKVAQATYDKLQAGVAEDEVALAEANIATAQYNLSVAQKALEGATITTPISGTIMSIDASEGDTVDGPFITINKTTPITLTVSLDETDLTSVGVGYEVEVVFDAFEDQTFTGQITMVNPSLSTMGMSVVQATVVLDDDTYNKPQNIPIGISAVIQVINERAEDAVLVPVEALIDMGDGTYAVFVKENGKLTFREVEVGIQDGTYAEITNGLEASEVVTTGIVETH